MASTYSTNLGLELIGTGDQSGTWGATTNTNLGTLLEEAIGGYVTQAITDGSAATTTITIPNGASGVARNMFIEMTGALTYATTSLIVPAKEKMYFVYNNTSGGFAVTVKVSGQTGILVPNGKKVVLTCNGTDIVEAHTAIVGNATMGGTLGVTGATTLSSTLGVTGATTLSSTLGVTGATTLSSTLGVTGITTVAAGSAALPAIVSTTGTADTGLWFPAADTVAASTGGTERIRIDSSGNVGIGTSSPSASAKLTLAGTSTNSALLVYNNTAAANTGLFGSVAAITGSGTSNDLAIGAFGSSNMTFYTNATERMRIDTSGNVGIGTSSPSTKFTVSGTQTIRGAGTDNGIYTCLYMDENTAPYTSTFAGYTLSLNTGNNSARTSRLYIDPSGNVGIGTNSPGALLHVGTTTAKIRIGATAGSEYLDISRDSATGNIIYNAAQTSFGTHNFQIAGIEAMRIDTSGYLLVGCTSIPNVGIAGQYGFSSSVSEVVISKNTSGSTPAIYIRTSAGASKTPITFYNDTSQVGSITTSTTATAYNTSSDHRLKENVHPMTTGLATISALKPVTYDWIGGDEKGEGFIAHELQEIVPLAVFGKKDAVDADGKPKYQGVDYSKIVVHLVAAIKELSAKVTALESK